MGIGCLLARFCHGGLRLPAADEHLPQFPPQKLFGGAMRRAQRRLNAAPGPPACGLWRQDQGWRRTSEKGGPRGEAPEGERGGEGIFWRKEGGQQKEGMPRTKKRGKAAARETGGHKKPKTAHCGRIAAARGKSGRAFGGPDARAMQARTIVPRPRQAALNFGQPRPPRRL